MGWNKIFQWVEDPPPSLIATPHSALAEIATPRFAQSKIATPHSALAENGGE